MKRWLISALGYVLLTTAALAQIGGLSFPGPGPRVSTGGGPVVPAFIPTNSGHHENGGTVSTTVSVTLPAPVVSGAACMGQVSYQGTPVPISITDDKANLGYTPVDETLLTSIDFAVFSFYILNVTNAPQTITATIPSNSNGAIQVDCFSGILASGALDGNTIQNQLTSPGTGANAVTSGSITTTASGDLIYGFSLDAASAGLTAGTGFTMRQAVLVAYFTESSVQSAAGTTAATFTAGSTPAGSSFTTFVMAFKHQ